ncbi:MAG: DUF2252 domain-containing protein [Hyphomicrobiales bacterium]|nr:DUF2252 domain-containing protein [Hyphomicrobiales bacterium]
MAVAFETPDHSGERRERYARGKALRKATPREAHADFAAPERDCVAILAAQDAHRIAALLPLRYERMTESPFAFLRGAAAVMAVDLAGAPMAGAKTQACGDCHLMNFGAFASPENNILFDINDFDETAPGVDFTVDLKRLCASAAVAAQAVGLSDKRARLAAKIVANAYRRHMLDLALLSPLEIWRSRIDLPQQIASFSDPRLSQRLRNLLMRADRSDGDDNFAHLVTVTAQGARIADRDKLVFHLDPGDAAGPNLDAAKAFDGYLATLPPERALLLARYRLADFAFKVVGVGSVGTFCAIGLFTTADNEPLFLQIKEAQASVLAPLAAPTPPEQGRRVVEGQQILQAASDVFLGWSSDASRHFYVRHLKNRSLGAISDLLEGEALFPYARLCGRTLARAHARSSDPAVLAGYMGKSELFDDSLASFAMKYAAQTTKDHAALAAAKGVKAPAKKAGRKDKRPEKRAS